MKAYTTVRTTTLGKVVRYLYVPTKEALVHGKPTVYNTLQVASKLVKVGNFCPVTFE